MERIIIKNFGPIKYVDMSLDKQFNVIIGPQATGKSTIAKCINYFGQIDMDFQRVLLSFLKPGVELEVDKIFQLAKDYGVKRAYDYFGAVGFEDATVVKCYFYDDYYVELSQEQGITELLYCDKLTNALKKVIEEMLVVIEKHSKDTKLILALQTLVFNRLQQVFHEDGVTFLPAGRSNVITNITADLDTNISEISRDVCIQQFVTNVKIYKNIHAAGYFQQVFKKHFNSSDEFCKEFQEMERLQMKVLKGKYLLQDGNDYIELTNKKLVPIIFASSGQQETVWVMNILGMKVYEYISSGKSNVLIIEEPEAHLYPTAQLDIVKYLVLVTKMTHSKLFITTHSPYILSAINLLVHSGSVENELEKMGENCEEIISKALRIGRNQMSAYKLFSDEDQQKFVSVLSDENGMIDFSEIDEVSMEINEATDKLIGREIKYGL